MADRVKLNYSAFKDYRQSAGVQQAVHQLAEKIAARATSAASVRGAMYTATAAQDTGKGSSSLVVCSNFQAKLDQNKHNTLSHAIGGSL